MKSAATKKSVIAKKPTTVKTDNKKEATLYLVKTDNKPSEPVTSKYQAGDMDMLERYEEQPMPAVFEQFDRSYKATRNFLGWPFAIV